MADYIDRETTADLRRRFTHHPPGGTQPERYESIREQALQFALNISKLCPSSRERSLAFTRLDEVVMFANAAIARNEEPVSDDK